MHRLFTLPSLALLGLALGAGACTSKSDTDADAVTPEPNYVVTPFPAGLVWGTANAGFQHEMGCPTTSCLDTGSDWYQWVTDQSIIDAKLVKGDPVEEGPGQWELFESDMDLVVEEVSQNGYRMSLEWSRIFPNTTDSANTDEEVRALADPAAVKRYHEMLQAMRSRKITPLVTLNHYSLPLWLHDGVACHNDVETCENRGWLDSARMTREVSKYARFVADEFGGEIDLWGTFNEPFAVILAGYAFPEPAERTNPPGIKDFSFGLAVEVINAMIEAHAKVYDNIHAMDTVDADGDGEAAMVGLIPNLASVASDQPETEIGERAVANAFHLYNRLMLDALVLGEWDPDMDGEPNEIREDLLGRMDFVGINYYLQLLVKAMPNSLSANVPLLTFLPDPFNLGGSYPPGIYEVSMFVAEEYGLPIYITENSFSVAHIAWLRKAVEDGADVRGYFHWCFIDQYEWNHGFATSGIYAYDHATKVRIPKPERISQQRSVAENNGLTPELLRENIGEWLPPGAVIPDP